MNSIFQNRLYDWLTTACQLIVLGFLFLFTSIPLVTFGASFTALYHCISREHAKTSAHICREYFSAFKSNFLQCLAPTILFLFYGAAMAVDLSQVFTGKATNLLPPFLWMVIFLVLWVLANYIFAVISHLRASFPAILLLSVRLMAGHIKETFILLFTMAGACVIVFLVPGLFVLLPGILCCIASHLIEPGLKKALTID